MAEIYGINVDKYTIHTWIVWVSSPGVCGWYDSQNGTFEWDIWGLDVYGADFRVVFVVETTSSFARCQLSNDQNPGLFAAYRGLTNYPVI